MSDLEDIDPGAEDLHLEEELSAPPGHAAPAEHMEEGLEEHFEPPKSGGAVVKIVIAALLVAAAGGAYFVLKAHHSASQTRIAAQALSVPPLPPAAPAPAAIHADAPAVPAAMPPANGSMAAPAMPQPPAAPATNVGTAASAMPSIPAPPNTMGAPSAITPPLPVSAEAAPPVASSMPAAIPALPSAVPVAPPAGPPGALSPTPPIVNDQPPSAALLTSTQGAAKPNMPSPSEPISGATPEPIPSGTSPLAPSHANKSVAENAETGINALPSQMPSAPQGPQIKNGEAMPSAIVPPVDKTEMTTGETGKDETAKSKVFSPNGEPSAEEAEQTPKADDTAESAKVEELQKKIDELEKTISQLQQAPVTKEEAEKTAGQSEETAGPKASRKKISAHHRRPSAKTHHIVAAHWVLKAAKPGVAWVARKGSDDLKMVEVGDSLTGVGKVTAIVKSSSGYWTVNGTKGRISQ